MPGVLPSESGAASRGSPSKRSRLSLKLFQKKEAKRALDFAEPQDGGGSSPEPRGGDVYVGKHRVCVCVGGVQAQSSPGLPQQKAVSSISFILAIKLFTK